MAAEPITHSATTTKEVSMKKNKWDRLKLSDEELQMIKKEDRIEVIASIIMFIVIIAVSAIAMAIITSALGACE